MIPAARDLAGFRVVVTGGASGIGSATTELLMQCGAVVAVLDKETGGPSEAAFFSCDVTDAVGVGRSVRAAAEHLGGLDALVNNAGIGASGDVATNDDEEWSRVLDVNVIGVARVSRAALPYLRASSRASIVNVCSAVAHLGVRQRALYSASKGAVHALTLAMAADHCSEGIRVNAVSPGTTDTAWVTRLLQAAPDPEASAEALRLRQPLGRLVRADEVASAIGYLVSAASASVTGAVLRVDGGMTSLRL